MITKDRVESLLDRGMSLRKVATKFGVTYQSLQYHRRRWGCQPLRKAHTKGSKHACWRGGSYVDRWGYKMVLAPHRGKCNPYVAEHVLVAETKFGRLLKRNEVVHHINGRKHDNRPDNLLVCTRRQHKMLHAQLEAIAFGMIAEGKIQFVGGQYVRAA